MINFFSQKDIVFEVSLNTFCLVQHNENSINENSCLGMTTNSENNFISWKIKKYQTDLAIKDKQFNSDFEVSKTISVFFSIK